MSKVVKSAFRKYMESKDWTCRTDETRKKRNYESSVEITGNYRNDGEIRTSI